MKILCIQEKERSTSLSQDLTAKVSKAVEATGNSFKLLNIKNHDLSFCCGCLYCWSNNTDSCIKKDRMPEFKEHLAGSGLILYLCPILFGSFTPNLKTLIEKGFGCHLGNEINYPQLIIGYGKNTSDQERDCFIDIVEKHMGAADIVHPELSDVPIDVMVTGTVKDNDRVLEKIKQIYLNGSVK